MGQFGNQPDFATNDIKEVAPNNTISSETSLNASIIYIGDNTTVGTTGCMVVIPAGTVGPSVISGFSSPGYAGSGGTGYVQGTEYDLLGGSGTALAAEFNVVNGAIVSVITITSGVQNGYLNGDIVTVDGGDGNATLRVVAAPGPPTAAQAVTFKGLGTGGFLPVTVDYVLATGTTVAELIAAK